MKEEVVVKRAIKGNSDAFEELMTRYQEQMYRTAYLYLGNQEDSLDVVQESVYQALKNIKQVQKPKYFKTWLMRIVINNAMALNKKKAQVIFFPEGDEREGMDAVIYEESIERQTDSHLDITTALAQLKESYRKVIILYYYQSLSVREIGQVLELSEGTVKTNLARGRQALKETLLKEDKHDERQTN